ncbi:MAG: hypothetical protein FWD71_08450 [Oscillospiraceae bacterium]|nr:hypothetical protein [Oscillospiraceae bacterium]
MNEKITNESMAQIGELNRIEGFNPEQFAREISDDGRNPRKYLDVIWRKLWFRLKYPQGKITTHIIELKEKYAVIEAKVYLDKNDPAENYIANAISQRWVDTETSFGSRFIESAETAAIGRALANAGFGLQFCCDKNEDKEADIVDSPIDGKFRNTQTENPVTAYIPSAEEIDLPFETNTLPDTFSVSTNSQPNNSQDNAAPQTLNLSSPMNLLVNTKNNATSAATVKNAASDNPAPQDNQEQKPKYNKSTPVPEIYRVMKLEDARNCIVDVGDYRGKTMQQVANEKLSSVEWYVRSYNGPNNILRAAAKIVLEVTRAEQEAS